MGFAEALGPAAGLASARAGEGRTPLNGSLLLLQRRPSVLASGALSKGRLRVAPGLQTGNGRRAATGSADGVRSSRGHDPREHLVTLFAVRPTCRGRSAPTMRGGGGLGGARRVYTVFVFC